jgi:predicted nucleotidyltransferase/DNA-binding XRE family transcriptional regulator
MNTGQLIKEARTDAGLSQVELALRARTSQPAIAKYESGLASPSLRTLDRILRAAGVRLELSTTPMRSNPRFDGELFSALQIHRMEIQRIVKSHGGENVRVFGSVARGEESASSDIDLLIDLDVADKGSFALMSIEEELAKLLQRKIDVAPTHWLKPHIRRKALAEAISL